MDIVTISTDALSVGVAPAYGARVVSLRDRAAGREWMAPGGFSDNAGEDAVYAAAECVGWDECFPTVSPWDAGETPWGRPLRDHGDLWGRPFAVIEHGPTRLVTLFEAPLFTFERTLDVAGGTLTATYRVSSRADEPLPTLWALHALLAVTPQDRIAVPNVATMSATHLARAGQTAAPTTLTWPGGAETWPDPLDVILPVTAEAAAKLYADGVPAGRASVGNGRERLDIAWDDTIPSLGLWLNYGGWPTPGPLHHIALEPTTAPVDDLGSALRTGREVVLAPGETRGWRVRFSVDGSGERAE